MEKIYKHAQVGMSTVNTLKYMGGLVCDNPKKHIGLKSKYPSTMSDDLVEHILSILNPVVK